MSLLLLLLWKAQPPLTFRLVVEAGVGDNWDEAH